MGRFPGYSAMWASGDLCGSPWRCCVYRDWENDQFLKSYLLQWTNFLNWAPEFGVRIAVESLLRI